jgi:sodium/potassium-transporting ATPase subunit alpha
MNLSSFHNATAQLSLATLPLQETAGSPLVLVMKGAPERVLQRCSKIMMHGVAQDLTEEMRELYQTAYEQLGGFGERVLGFAYRDMEEDEAYPFSNKPEPNFETDGLTFVGLISLIDPPREGVPEAVCKCKRARIRVFMVTGDHPITARAIALQVRRRGSFYERDRMLWFETLFESLQP